MDVIDPSSIASGAAAAKSVIDTLKGLFGLIKDGRDLLSPSDRQKADVIVEQSLKQLAIAEAQLAQSLGYELCKCEFPPTPMLSVGYTRRGGVPARGQDAVVFECPKCHQNTAGPHMFTRSRTLPD